MAPRRFLILTLILFVFFSSDVYSLNISIKKIYAPSETLIAEMNGYILEPLLPENVEFKRENVRVPLEYDIKKIDEKYFLWAIAPEFPGNYTLLINSVSTTQDGKNAVIDFAYNFSVSGQLAEYSVKPGFIITSGDTELDVTLNRDTGKTVSIGKRSVFLLPGENKILVSLDELIYSEQARFQVGDYFLPIKLIDNNFRNVILRKGLTFVPSIITIAIGRGEKTNYSIEVKNLEDREMKNIHFAFDESKFSISPTGNFSLSPNQTKNYTIVISNVSNLQGYEEIYVRSNNSYARLIMEILLPSLTDSNKTENKNTTNISNNDYRCSEIRGGRFCDAEQTCSGEIVRSLDGNCCIGTCSVKKKPSGAWIGYVLAILMIGVLGYVYYNYKKTKSKGEGESFKKKVKEAEEKLP